LYIQARLWLAIPGQKLIRLLTIGIADVKPDNILVSYNAGQGQFSEVEFGDCSNVYHIPLEDNSSVDRPVIGAAMFRSPEVNLSLRWDTSTDIWSLGTPVNLSL